MKATLRLLMPLLFMLGLTQQCNGYTLNMVILLEAGRSESFYRKKQTAFGPTLADLIRQKTSPIIVSGVMLHNVLKGAKFWTEQLKIKNSTADKLQIVVEKAIDLNAKQDSELATIQAEIKKYKAHAEQTAAQLKKAQEESTDNPSFEANGRYLDAIREEGAATHALLMAEMKDLRTQTDYLNAINPLISQFNAHIDQPGAEKATQHLIYAQANFSFDEWVIYKSTVTELYLLIPKNYITVIETTFEKEVKSAEQISKKMGITYNEALLGLNIDNEKVMAKVPSLEKLESLLSAQWDSRSMRTLGASATLNWIFFKAFPEYQFIDVEALKSFFVPNKALPGAWNIYLGGHGYHSDNPKAQAELGETEGFIAGMTNKQFANFLQFVTQKVNTLLLNITTCYGGGFHASWVAQFMNARKEKAQTEEEEKKIIGDLHAKNIIVVSAITDAVTVSPGISLLSVIEFDRTGKVMDFKKYFDDARKLQHASLDVQDNLLKEVLGDISVREKNGDEDLHGISGTPLVWYPGLKNPKALEIDDKVVAVTDRFKNQEIRGKKALLFYEKNVNFPVTIAVDSSSDSLSPAIVIMSPENIITTFAQITAKVKTDEQAQEEADEKGGKAAAAENYLGLDRFLKESIFQLASVFKKRYFIKKLFVKNYADSGILQSKTDQDLELEDVAIKKSAEGAHVIKGQVIFKIKNDKGASAYYVGQWDGKNHKIKSWKQLSAQDAAKEYKKYVAE